MPERRAYVCTHRSHDDLVPRRFIGPDDEVPTCPIAGHGKMKRQANMPYVKPDPDAPIGKPRRVKPARRT